MTTVAVPEEDLLRERFGDVVEEAMRAFLLDPHYLIDMALNSNRIARRRAAACQDRPEGRT